MFGKVLSWIDGPIISRLIGAVVGGIMAVMAKAIVMDPDQTNQFSQALITIVTILAYAFTHNGIKLTSAAAGNDIAPPAGTSVTQ